MAFDINNFYEDYAFNPEDFENLVNMYRGVIKNISDYISPLQDNRIARYIEDFRIIPTQYIDTKEGTYDPEVIFTSDELKVWNDIHTSTFEKVELLRNRLKFITLTANRQLLQREQSDKYTEEFSTSVAKINNGEIVDFILKDPFDGDRTLSAGLDYYYSNNQLFMLGDYADPSRENTILKMTDIAVNFETVDDILGKNLNLPFKNEFISKIEFNDFVRILTLSAIKGFKLNSVLDGVNELPLIGDLVQVFDKFTDDPEKAELWDNVSNGLGMFDFVIMYPLTLDTYRISLIHEYLDAVRHVFTNSQVIGYDFYEDEIYNVDNNFDELREDVIYKDWSGEADLENSKFESERFIASHIKDEYIKEDEIEFNESDLDNHIRLDELVDSEVKLPTGKQLYTDGDRVTDVNLETGKVTTSKENPTVTDDANSRLGYADDEDKSN